MRTERQGIIVWFQHMKNLKQIRRYGHLLYSSKKLKYAVIYVNQDDLEDTEHKLLKLSFVTKVDRSYKPLIRTDYENAKPDKAKEYDYKMGI
ncbi:YlbG family protein [Virgibacillus flavescens]|uniref:YlbG family protein n=1 Tax=Virgibacillus flavescens TaxID=1611422 RepID=UPI003D33664F